jgi:hypothetical protein
MLFTEEYPSPAEGIGLENRQAGHTAQGFESPFLLHFFILILLSRGGATSVSPLNKLRVVPIEPLLD